MSASAQSESDLKTLIDALERSRENYLKAVISVSEKAAGVKLNDSSWSILKVAEHVAAAEHGMSRSLEMATVKTTPTDIEMDRQIVAGSTNRENKRQAPERVHPKGRWKSLAECVEAFKVTRAKTIDTVRNAEGLRSKLVMHPLAGELDGFQQVLVMAGHCERHALQIEEIKASAAYKAVADTN